MMNQLATGNRSARRCVHQCWARVWLTYIHVGFQRSFCNRAVNAPLREENHFTEESMVTFTVLTHSHAADRLVFRVPARAVLLAGTRRRVILVISPKGR